MEDLNEVKKIIISLICTFPNGRSADNFNRDYKEFTGTSIPFSEYSYPTLLAFLEAELKNNIRIESRDMNIWLYPISTEKSGHITKMIQEQCLVANKSVTSRSYKNSKRQQCVQPQIRPKAQSSVMPRLIEYNPSKNQNIPLHKTMNDQSQQQYSHRQKEQMVIGSKIDQINSNQYATIVSNVACDRSATIQKFRNKCIETKDTKMQPDIQHILHKSSNEPQQEQKTKFPLNDFEWESSKESLWEDELDEMEPMQNNARSKNLKLLPSALTQEISKITLLDDNRVGEKLEIKNLLDEFKIGDEVPARLSDVNNPFKFWIHLRGEKYETQLKILNEKMQEFYAHNHHCNDPIYVDSNYNGSSYFALQYSDYWFRVELLGVENESVKVSFIDHGSRVSVNISELRKLHKQFYEIPKAVVCCSLGNITPIGKAFTDKSADAFLKLIEDQKFNVKILDIVKEKSKAIVEINLLSKQICVNDELIRLGHALSKC